MANRTGSHQLSNGLMVSGRPENPPTRLPSISPRATIPFTGTTTDSNKSTEMYAPPPTVRSGPNSNSGPKPYSGPIPKKTTSSSSFSGPITPTGLITSGPISSARRSGQLEGLQNQGSMKKVAYGSSVTGLKGEAEMGFRVSKVAMWAFFVVVVMGLLVGVFLLASVKRLVVLVGVFAVLVPVVLVGVWNWAYKKRGILSFLNGWKDCELRGAVDGQFVKVTGVVTCGGIPLETSFQRLPRCVYVSSELYEYRGCGGKPANTNHRLFSWGCRHSEKHVADFYISDYHSGLRALVKAGYGAKVAPFVEPSFVVDVNKNNKESSPNFLRWLSDRGLSSDDRIMRLKESYIKEGSTVSVMGVVRRHENVLMIVPPSDPISTGWRWLCCLLPTYIEGLIMICDESQNVDAIPV